MAKTIDKKVNIWINQQGIDNNLKAIRAEINKTSNELNKLPIGTEEWYKKSEKLTKLKGIYNEVRDSIEGTKRSLTDTAVLIGGATAAIHTANTAIGRFISTTQQYVDAYATLDDAMTNVSKYTGLTREEVKQLNEEFRKMDTRTPTEKLNALAADAGRLGITSKEAIKDFVEAADIINVALGEDLGEDAVKEIGKLAEMFGTTNTMGLRGAMLATGSAINTLAQSSSASERYLMDFTSRLSGAANQAKMTQAEVLGFASVLDQNKQQVEMSATAMQKLMMDMFTEPAKYAKLAGMSVNDFSDLLKNDANEALLSFFETLNRKGGLSDLAPIFDKLSLDGARASGVISVLAQNIDDVRKEQELANTAFQEGTSVINEAAAVNGNAAAQLEKAKKAVEDAKAALGEELLPVITELTKGTASGIKILIPIVKYWTQHKALLISLASAYGLLLLAQKAVIASQEKEKKLTLANTVAGKAYTLVTKMLAVAKAKLAADTKAAAAAQAELKAAFATTPWGAIIVAIGAIATGIGSLVSKQREASRSMMEFTNKCESEKMEAKRLFEQLGKTTEGSEEYRAKLEEIKKLYPDIINKHIDENGLLIDQKKALDDVCKSLENKIALEMSENEKRKLIKKSIEKQTSALRGFQDEQRKIIKEMTDQGYSTEDIGAKIGISYYFTDHMGQPVKDERFQQLKDYVKSYRKMKEGLQAIDRKYKQHISSGNTTTSAETEHNPDDTEHCMCEACKKRREKEKQYRIEEEIKKRAAFDKKFKELEEKSRIELLGEWDKTKEVINKEYKELADESIEAYGKQNQYLAQIEQMRLKALETAGKKYLDKYGKLAEEVSEKMKQLEGEDGDKEDNKLLASIAVSDREWNKLIAQIEENIKNIEEVWDTLTEDEQKQYADFRDFCDQQETLLLVAQQKRLKAAAKIIADYMSDETKTIENELKKQERERLRATLNEKELAEKEKEWKIADINEEYDIRIEAMEEVLKAKRALNDDDEEGIRKIEEAIEKLKQMKQAAIDMVSGNGAKKGKKGKKGGSVWDEILNIDWKNFKDNALENIGLITQGLQSLADAAADVYSSIAEIQKNEAQADLNAFIESQDEKSKVLEQQLEDGIISQEYYNAEMERIEAEKAAKEKEVQHEQFEQEKRANIVTATIQGILGAMVSFVNGGGYPAGLITMALSIATTAAQIAAIASQANPYARGGFITKKQLALMGEEGKEWVASNKLLEDDETAPIIAALEEYQRGNKKALEMIVPQKPNWKNLSQTAKNISSNFASNKTPIINNYYTNQTNSEELLNEIRKMNDFLSDPKNRQAYISFKLQEESKKNREFIKNAARI